MRKQALHNPHFGDSSSKPGWVTAFLVILVVATFMLGFLAGSKKEEQFNELSLNTIHRREDAVRQQYNECRREEQKYLDDSKDFTGEERNLGEENQRLQNDNAHLSEIQNRLEQQNAMCMEEGESQRARWGDTDAKALETMTELTEQNAVLRDHVNRLGPSVIGQRQMLLIQALNRQKGKNFELRQRLGMALPSASYLDELVEKWGGEIDKMKKHPLGRLSEEDVQHTIAAGITNMPKFEYKPDQHPAIFIPRVTTESPSHFDFTGSRALFKGTAINEPGQTIGTLAQTMNRLTTYALCAFRHNNPNFTYPYLLFRDKDTKDAVQLQDFINTPLLSFCTSCRPMAATAEFRLACWDDMPSTLYGSYDFWATRSKIRFQPRFYEDAAKFVKDNVMGRYLAVSLRTYGAICNLTVGRMPMQHYMYVMSNVANKSDVQLQAGREEQCYPPPSRIESLVKQALAKSATPYDAVYVMMRSDGGYNITDIQAADFGVRKIISFPRNFDEDVLDIVIGSMASTILVNAFNDHSQAVTEFFLLQNTFKTDGILFF